jgi:hypothetical protein
MPTYRTFALLSAPFLLLAGLHCGGDDEAPAGTTGSGGGATTSTSGAGGAGGEGGAGGQGPAGSLEADYCAPLAALVCERAVSCGCAEVLPGGTLDSLACIAAYTARCLDAYAGVASAVAAGDAQVDAEAAAACIALLASTTPGCERPRGTVALGLCPAWVASDVPLGADCSFPLCAGGEGQCVGGSCVPRPGANEPCQGLECQPGLLCLESLCNAPAELHGACSSDETCAPPLRCVAGSCEALAPEGASCQETTACDLGLQCQASQCAPPPAGGCADAAACGNLALCADERLCAARAAEGEACTTDETCATGLGCDPATLLCVPFPGDGQPCQNGTLCGPGLACDNDFGNCAPLPGDGAPCAFGPFGPSVCASGLGCVNGTCGPLPVLGEPCTVDNRCADGLGCDYTPSGSFCVALKDEGGDCQNDFVCSAGLHCDFGTGTCAPDYATGAPCSAGNECGKSGTCAPGNGGAFVCGPRPGAGEGCLFECADDLVCASQPGQGDCVPEVCLEL